MIFIQCEFLNPDGTASKKKYFYQIYTTLLPEIEVGDIIQRKEIGVVRQSFSNPFDIVRGEPVNVPENENPIRVLKVYDVEPDCFPSDLKDIAATGTWRCISDYIEIEKSKKEETNNGEFTSVGALFDKLEKDGYSKSIKVNPAEAEEVAKEAEEKMKGWFGLAFNNEPTHIKEENNMNIKNLMGNAKFGKLDDANIKYSFNGIAFRDAYSNYNTYNDGKLTNVSDMVIDVPVFAMPVPFTQIEIGDVILHPMRGNALIVQNIGDNAIDAIEPYTNELKTLVPVKSIFGFDFYTKIISLADGFGANANVDNPFGNILPFLMFGDGKMDKDTMLMFAMMNGGNGFGDMNTMLPFLLMSKGGDNDALSTLMLMNMFKNQTPAINANVPKEFADYVNDVSNKVEG